MDPAAPWYSPYNRLAAAAGAAAGGAAPPAADLHQLAAAAATATTTASGAAPPATAAAQLLSGGFLSPPPPVAYDAVFSPLFHHPAKPNAAAHYVTQVTQHRAQALAAAASKQSEGSEFHPSAQAFFEQGAAGVAWQQNSPFGILPHESVVATTTGKAAAYDNFNAHFAAAQSLNNHLNSQLAASKAGAARAQSPQVAAAPAKGGAAQNSSSTFYQVPEGTNSTKTFTSTNTSNLQQSCIVSSPSTTKEYRVPQAPSRTFLSSPNPGRNIEKTFASPPSKQQTTAQIQTKAQTKIYSELRSQQERTQQQQQQQGSSEEPQSQSSPISFSMLDTPGRLNYSGSNSSGKRPQQFQQNYRHYQQQQGSNSEEFQRPKSGEYQQPNSNGAECGNVVVPRRPSPLQAHSQASPIGHAQSPAYPMYHSPMGSMASPQQTSSQQVNPQSPLDVSVPRPNSQTPGSVAYPSVITRALNSDKTYPERAYERPNHQSAQQPPQQQNCWDERQQGRKYAPAGQAPQGNSYEGAQGAQGRQYFDGGQVLQDLSSCRGDPMSIVKNLQQQQSCQVQQVEVKQEVKQPAKRRKSVEKVAQAAPEVHIPSRVPPPAHTSAANQQQQNGMYFDFDRWNLPPPATKIFASQAALHQQHQELMVPHPHGPHPAPPVYFFPSHLPTPGSEYPRTIELTPLTTYNEQQAAAAAAAAQAQAHSSNQYQQAAQQSQSQSQQEDQPKVVVPNIEEELNFLSEDTTTNATNAVPRPPAMAPKPPHQMPQVPKPPDGKPTGPGAGFMSSYLKFLQGERDASPPPTVRNSRKPGASNWRKTENKSAETNGVPQAVVAPVNVPAVAPAVPVMRLSTQGDPQDDPRYFPLPKERKRGFDSSDDGFSSEDDFFSSKKNPLPPIDKKDKRKTRNKNGGEKRQKKMQDKLLKQQMREERQREKEKMREARKIENVPKREQKKREAKGKNSLSDIIKEENEADEPPEFQDSEDSDPAWTPAAINSDEDCLPVKKKGRGRQAKSKKGMKNLIAAAAQGAGITVAETTSPTEKKKLSPKKQLGPTLEDNIAASLPNSFSTFSDDNLSKPGEFVAIKMELNQDWPAIWRVDGKTLLQKYEPFEQDGVTLYRNISTYTSWTPESKKQYVSVPVIVRSQGQLETIVEFLKHEMNVIDHEYHEKCMKQYESYQDNFEVYIQTLISQALDSNFLMEIFQEKDEYFLSNVQKIDDLTETGKRKLLSVVEWPPTVRAAVCTWPCYNVIRDAGLADRPGAPAACCTACGRGAPVAVRVLMYGQPYNATTLEGCQPDPAAAAEKDFYMCRLCASRVELASKVIHQKYLMYIECAKRVSEKRTSDPTKDTTCILNELLADEVWLNQLFSDVRTLWAEIDSIEHSFKMKESVCAQ